MDSILIVFLGSVLIVLFYFMGVVGIELMVSG